MPVVRFEETGVSASSSVGHAALTFAVPVAWVDGVPRRMAGFKDVALSAFVASGTAARARASALSHVGSNLRPDARGVCWRLRARRSVGSLAPLGCTTRMNTYLTTDYLSEQLAGCPGAFAFVASSPAVVADNPDLGLPGFGSMWHGGGRGRGGVIRRATTGVSLICSTYLCPRPAAFLAPPSLGGWPFCWCVSCAGTWGGQHDPPCAMRSVGTPATSSRPSSQPPLPPAPPDPSPPPVSSPARVVHMTVSVVFRRT